MSEEEVEGVELEKLFAVDVAGAPPPGAVGLGLPSLQTLDFLRQLHGTSCETLKGVVRGGGSWPAEAMVGPKAAAAAFLIVHHADYDPAFQRECHRLMLESVKHGRSKPGYLAFLTDRILCNAGHPQRFGTQFREVANGCFVPKPLEDPDRVDALRRMVGLRESLSDYLQRLNGGDLVPYRLLMTGGVTPVEAHAACQVLPFPAPPARH